MTVQGTGINEGGLKVGDGKVVLNQQADNKGQVQAFSSVNIASGRPTVVLTDDAYSALFDHGLASKSDQRFASIRSTGNLTFSTAF
ncbi:TPA: hypothetical protein IHL49_004722 [Escherichia coli]|nr:hypothetical protein [Escherichia coli]